MTPSTTPPPAPTRSSSSILTIDLPGFHSLRCTSPVPAAGQPPLQGRAVILHLDDGDFVLRDKFIARARGYSATRVYDGVIRLMSRMKNDAALFAPLGFDAAWLGFFQADANRLLALSVEAKNRVSTNDVLRKTTLSVPEQADALVRRVLHLAQTADLRGWFGAGPADLQSLSGLRSTLRDVHARARVPAVRERLLRAGATPLLLAHLDAAPGRLRDYMARRADQKADDPKATLLPATALVLGEITLVSKLARTELPPTRQGVYRLSVLLPAGRARRPSRLASHAPLSTRDIPPASGA